MLLRGRAWLVAAARLGVDVRFFVRLGGARDWLACGGRRRARGQVVIWAFIGPRNGVDCQSTRFGARGAERGLGAVCSIRLLAGAFYLASGHAKPLSRGFSLSPFAGSTSTAMMS